MPKYMTLDGTIVGPDAINRGVWYSTRGTCGFWTDDWSALGSFGDGATATMPDGRRVEIGGVPCCPTCGCPGFQSEWSHWKSDADKFELEHPHYVEFLLAMKGKCRSRDPKPWMVHYREWLAKEKS